MESKGGSPTEYITQEEQNVLEALDSYGIRYVRLTHPAAVTMELCRGIGASFGASHCKNLLLTNRSGKSFHLLLMEADKPYRTADVSRRLGVSRLSFASADQLKEVMGLSPGCVSVMGLLNDCARSAYKNGFLHVAIDADLLKRQKLCVHPNVSTATLVMDVGDILRLLSSIGVEYSVTEV